MATINLMKAEAAEQLLASTSLAVEAAARSEQQADRSANASDAAAAQVIADHRVLTDADRLALSGLGAGTTVYVIDTGHTWQWNGSAWVDLGQGAFALKADKAAVAGLIRGDDATTTILAAIRDKDGLRTWLEARSQDGGPTDWSATLIAAAMTRLGLLSDDGIVADLTHIVGWGSSTIEYMAADLASMAANFGSTYVDGGDAGVTGYVTLAQMGVEHALITFPSNTIPASGASLVTCSNVTFSALMRPWVAMIAGVSGTLSWAGGGLTFTRAQAGGALVLLGETPAIPAMSQYRRAVTLLNIGKNSLTGSASAEDVVEMTSRAWDWISLVEKKALVIGHFVDRDTAAVSAVRDKIVAVNRRFAAHYGDLYVDLSGYLISARVWVDVGITPSAEDLDAQSIGNIPPSLALADGIHMTPAAQAAFVTHILTPKITALGWYA
ncbi:hypothetical protein D2T31_00660 [Sinirhodobacter populi]|uniref:Uncharacterized protein n=1 Tax=Paenirhodobacter populi TaxID=2306993 RepID=A0A443KIE4_9RHOB|nr:hypothetical protein [Sinirhodobacter populi]RWR32529.1 hypothetical protein D2T31_00660 [Sinirhodobacter populi]